MLKSLGLNPIVNLQIILWVKSQQTAGQCLHKSHFLDSCQFLCLVEFFKPAEESDCCLKGSYFYFPLSVDRKLLPLEDFPWRMCPSNHFHACSGPNWKKECCFGNVGHQLQFILDNKFILRLLQGAGGQWVLEENLKFTLWKLGLVTWGWTYYLW